MRIVPTTAVPMKLSDLFYALPAIGIKEQKQAELEQAFASYIGVRHCLAVNKGTTALYLSLLAMKKMAPGKTEVILPAYTVPTLTLAINMAGLKTRLCDVAPDTFNMDPKSLKQYLSPDTLAVVPVHMFGFPCALAEIKEMCRSVGAFVLEDPAQAMGAELDGRKVGAHGDTALFSLCKGKIISTYSGGLAVTDDDQLAVLMREERARLPQAQAVWQKPMVLAAFTLAMRPGIYGALYPLISRFKSTRVHDEFHPCRYTDFQAAVALPQIPRLDMILAARIELGRFMYEALKDYDWLILPRIVPRSMPIYNHLPVVFKDKHRLKRAEELLWKAGIDTARMYKRPIHRIYDLAYPEKPDPFPAATFIAKRLLTLPSHPYMSRFDAERIIEVFRRIARGR